MKKILFVITLLVLAVPFNVIAQKRTIELNLTVKETYTSTQSTHTEMTQKIEGQDINSIIDFAGSYSFKVVDFSDDIYTLETRYEALSMKIKMPNLTIDVNTANQEDGTSTPKGIITSLLSSLIDKPFTIKMKKNGSIESIKGHEEMATQSFTEFFETMPKRNPQKEKAFSTMLEKSINDEAMKSLFEKSLNVYPEASVAVNGTWKKTINNNSMFGGYYDIDYSFTGINDEFLTLKGTGELIIPNKDQYTKFNGMEVKMIMLGKYNCDYKIDPKTGWIIEGKITSKSGGEMMIKANEQLPEDMTIQMNTNGITTIN